MTDFILQTKRHSTMLSIWTEELHCHVDEDGEITLSVSKTDSELTEWLPELDGIRTPSDFNRAIKFLVEEWSGTWTLNEIVDVLVENYPSFGNKVRDSIHQQKSTTSHQKTKRRASKFEHKKFSEDIGEELIVQIPIKLR